MGEQPTPAWKRRLGVAAGAAFAGVGVAISLIGGLVASRRQRPHIRERE